MIENLFKNKPLFLAPMAGVTDFGFRSVAKNCGADLTCTEMISAKGLIYDSEKTKKMLFTCDNESTKMVQLFGNVPNDFVKCLTYLDDFDIIDINFGCPAPKIFNNNQGSALLNQPLLIYEIVNTLKKNTNKTISAKIRLGIEDKSLGLGVARVLQDAGADFISVHGRSKLQGYSGQADYEAIATIKQKLKIKVVGNGDVKDEISLHNMWQTGVDGIMIGRASLGNPQIFSKLKNLPTISKIQAIENHIKLLQTQYDNNFLSKYLRKHLLWYLKDVKDNDLKFKICSMTDVDMVLTDLKKYFLH